MTRKNVNTSRRLKEVQLHALSVLSTAVSLQDCHYNYGLFMVSEQGHISGLHLVSSKRHIVASSCPLLYLPTSVKDGILRNVFDACNQRLWYFLQRAEAGRAGLTPSGATELDEETKSKLIAYKVLNRFIQAFLDHVCIAKTCTSHRIPFRYAFSTKLFFTSRDPCIWMVFSMYLFLFLLCSWNITVPEHKEYLLHSDGKDNTRKDSEHGVYQGWRRYRTLL